MDEALREDLRSGDWEARARAYRRTGAEDRARRWVAQAARSGAEGAREHLEAEFPLDADARALLEVLVAPLGPTQAAPWSAQILLGDGDPRLSEAALAWLGKHSDPIRGQEGFGHLLIHDHVQRIAYLLGSVGPGLERTWLSPAELRALLERVPRESWSPQRRLSLLFLIAASGDEALGAERDALLAPELEDSARLRTLLSGQGGAGGLADSDLPWRPGWVRPLLRDALTLALSRHALRGRHLPPDQFELPRCDSIGLAAIDAFGAHNDHLGFEASDVLLREVTASLQEAFGDRVVRWGGNRWLIPYEGSDGSERFRACLETVRADPTLRSDYADVTVSVALISSDLAKRVPSWAASLEEALHDARYAGGGTLELIPEPS